MPDNELTIHVKMTAGFKSSMERAMLDVLTKAGEGHDLQMLTEQRVARVLGVSVAYVRKHLVKAGHLTVVTMPMTGEQRIPLKSLEQLVARLLAEGDNQCAKS